MAPRISPVDETRVDERVRTIFADAERRGAPNATLLRLLARQPTALHAFYDGWQATFYAGEVPHTLKELMRVRMARLRNCGY
jgi:alkylhydroperoxidase family enzyme